MTSTQSNFELIELVQVNDAILIIRNFLNNYYLGIWYGYIQINTTFSDKGVKDRFFDFSMQSKSNFRKS